MCGIFGWHALQAGAEPKQQFLDTSLVCMKHRGPDAQAHKPVSETTHFGHLRLSIIDTSDVANQPMHTEASTIIFNGEIYNYKELAPEIAKTYTLHTASDTEILQRGLEKQGVDFLHKANGMFAFALHNTAKNTLLLGRDRFGVKPLYYSVIDNVFYFASEMTPLIRLVQSPKRYLPAYTDFLNTATSDHERNTFVDHVLQVLPGEAISIDSGNITHTKWYSWNDYDFDTAIFKHPKDTHELVEDLLTKAITLRLRSDVPLCLTLSGGLDSTTLYTLMKERLGTKLTLFTFDNADSKIDETAKVKELIAPYGDTVHLIPPQPTTGVEDIQHVLQRLEFPNWSAGGVAYAHTYKSIQAEGFTVVIEGHGSDEQLGGYPYMLEQAIVQYILQGKWRRAIEVARVYENSYIWSNSGPRSLINIIWPIVNSARKQGKLGQRMQHSLEDAFDRRILPIVLRTFDRLPMAYGLESRAPFMDYRVVEVFRKMPLHYKVNHLGTKAILREILKKYGKTHIYTDQRKIGFGIDVPQVFNTPATKQFLQQSIEQYRVPNSADIQETARKYIQEPVIDWQHTDAIWKVAALSYIDTYFGIE